MIPNYLKYWLYPCTISYSIKPSNVSEGFFIIELFVNGVKVRGRHAMVTKQEAVDYIKECWKYILRTPAKREKKIDYFTQ